MGYYADIYVIKNSRSRQKGIDFLNHFIPNRKESADEYLIPQYADNPKYEFDNANDLMEYLEENPKIEQSIYWNNLDVGNLNRHAMIFYTSESNMIFGISRNNYGVENTQNEEVCLAEMKQFLETDKGYITYECPPETELDEFIKMVNVFNKRQNNVERIE